MITSKGNISTQCDLIIYDKNNCPLIENNNKQRFFPIECVVAIGEIKSDLSKVQFKEALLKLKNNKLLRNDISNGNPFIFKDNLSNKGFDPQNNIRDQIITFLVCSKLNFKYQDVVNEMNEIYENCDKHLRHNMILSVNDGTLMYRVIEDNKYMFYPVMGKYELKNCIIQSLDSDDKVNFVKNNILDNKYEHIVSFLNYMYQGTSTTSILYPEMTEYLGNIRVKNYKEES